MTPILVYPLLSMVRVSLLCPPAVPPKRVVLEDPPARRAGSAVSLACTAEDSNPRTTLLWFRGNGEPILDAGTEIIPAPPEASSIC